MSAKLACLILLDLCFAVGFCRNCQAQNGETERQYLWRNEAHAGVNSLFLYLRALDRPVSYSVLIDQQGKLPESVTEMLSLSRRIGFPCVARRITPDDLQFMRLPLIVHVDGDDPSEGDFLMVTHIEDRVRFFECSSMLLAELSRESFLRRWNGVVILEDEAPYRLTRFYCTALIGLGLGFSIRYFFFRYLITFIKG